MLRCLGRKCSHTSRASVDHEIQKRNAYLVAENRMLRGQIKGRLNLCDAERITLAKLGKALGKKALKEVANVVKPETILAWHRKLVAKKFDGSKNKYPGRPKINGQVEALIVRLPRRTKPGESSALINHLGHWTTRSRTKPWKCP
ncbi:MAG: hypothetical protein R3C68_17820 [Myxococcota bacterium]